MVRCTHLREVPALRNAGATSIFSGEAEVGVAIAEAVHVRVASDCGDDIIREREAIRRGLYANSQ
jgi:hypothetical protein